MRHLQRHRCSFSLSETDVIENTHVLYEEHVSRRASIVVRLGLPEFFLFKYALCYYDCSRKEIKERKVGTMLGLYWRRKTEELGVEPQLYCPP